MKKNSKNEKLKTENLQNHGKKNVGLCSLRALSCAAKLKCD